MDDHVDDGRVVRELDVYMCAGNLPEATKVTAICYLPPPLPTHAPPLPAPANCSAQIKPASDA